MPKASVVSSPNWKPVKMITVKPWGHYRVIENGGAYLLKELVVQPGHRLSEQFHNHREEVWTCIAGQGRAEYGAATAVLIPGMTVFIGKQVIHRLVNTGDTELRIIEVWMGADLREDDIVRIEDDYNR
jgi:mannose-6-phosphate isomerase-like protein (cupin superfamily)